MIKSENYQEIYSINREQFNEVSSPIFKKTALKEGFSGTPTPFFYPPICILPFQFFTSLRFATARRVWVGISLLFALFSLPLLYQMVKTPIESFLKFSMILALIFLSYPLLYSLHLGQTTPMIFFFLCLIYSLTSCNRDRSAGIFLGIITLIKISPFLFIIYFLMRRRATIVFYSIITILVLTLISILIYGMPFYLSYFNLVREISRFDLVAWNNQSISAFLVRFITNEDVLKWHPISLVFPFNLCKFIFIFFFLITFLKQLKTYSAPFSLEYSAMIILILLLPSISWDHYFFYLIIPFILIIDHLLGIQEKDYKSKIILASLAYILTNIEIDFLSFFSFYPQDWFGKLLVSRIFLGALIFGILIIMILRQKK